MYYEQLQREEFDNIRSESVNLYPYAIEMLSPLFKSNSGIRLILNFGVCYVHIDNELADRFPQITFWGIDRSKLMKVFNEMTFGKKENVTYLAGDIFDLLESKRFDSGVFFHARTLCLLPKVFIERLYRKVFDAGFEYIVGIEQVGISRETGQFYQFSQDDKPSVLFRGRMYIHNYPGLANGCGFKLDYAELVKTNHPHKDFRLLSFTARKSLVTQNDSTIIQ